MAKTASISIGMPQDKAERGGAGDGRGAKDSDRTLSWHTLTGLGLAFAMNVTLARLMGVEGFGLLSFAVSLLIILEVVALFGQKRLPAAALCVGAHFLAAGCFVRHVDRELRRGPAEILAGCTILMNALLIPLFNLDGTATAAAISLAVWNIVTLYWAMRYPRINPSLIGTVAS